MFPSLFFRNERQCLPASILHIFPGEWGERAQPEFLSSPLPAVCLELALHQLEELDHWRWWHCDFTGTYLAVPGSLGRAKLLSWAIQHHVSWCETFRNLCGKFYQKPKLL